MNLSDYHSITVPNFTSLPLILAPSLTPSFLQYPSYVVFQLSCPHSHRLRLEHIAERYGAWVMLMLGESVLAIILQPIQDTERYYFAFFLALVTVQILQLTHFSSEEVSSERTACSYMSRKYDNLFISWCSFQFEPDKHALSRSDLGGRFWLELMTVFSIALVALGVGLSLLISSVSCSEVDNGHFRKLASSSEAKRYVYCDSVPRAYVALPCGASIAQYATQSFFIIPSHEGWNEYLHHFVDPLKKWPYFHLVTFAGVKAATIGATLVVALVPSDLLAHEILLILVVITMIQGLVQAAENMVVHIGQQKNRQI